jgi:hypothetical protein
MVGTLVVAAAAGTTAAGVAASFALTAAAFAVNFAVSLIVSRVFGQSGQGPQDSGTRQQVPPSNVNAIPIVYGDAYLGGTFVDAVLSTDQKTMYYVVAVSCVSPNGQFTFDSTKFYYGDRLVTFDGTDQTKVVSLTDEAGNVDTKINGNLFINLYRSTAAGSITPLNGASAPNVVMGGADIDAALRWPSSGRQMNGLAFAIIKLNYNQDAGTTNLSPVTFYAKHYLNSTGAAKPGDVWYDYITNAAYGGAVGTTFVNASSATALNAYSDQTITYTPSGGGSATQARYRMNGVLDAGQTVLSNLDKIMSCCDSWMAYNAALGQWSIVINKAETTSFAFNDNNIIGEIRVSATDITQSINQVEAKFPDKGARDQPNFVNIATPSGLLYPNEPDNKYSVTYDLCNDSVQAQYLANRILEQAREDLIVSFSTTYYGIQVDAGDVVSVTNSDYGWNNKLFRVVKVNEASLPDGSLGAKLEMTEYSAAVYDDYGITQYTPVPNSDIASVVYFSGLSAPTVTAANPSSSIPNFNVTISIPAIGRVTYSELYYTTVAIPTANDWKLLASATAIDGQPLTPSSTYVYSNQVLPTGASPSATYYFAYVVANDLARSARSPISSSFTWTPEATTGPTGPRNAQVFFYYNTEQATAPAAPTEAEVAYNFSTQVATISTAGWSALFNPSAPEATTANNKYWAVKVAFQEIEFGGAYTETISAVFTWQNLDGLVTFTNLATAQGPLGTGATFIDGGSIITESLSANRISSGNMINGSAAQAWIQMGQTGTVIASLKSSFNVRKVVSDTTLVNIAAQNNLDGNVTIWGHSANQAIGSGNGVSGSHTTTNTFASWQRLGALGSGVANAGVWGFTYADNANSLGGRFERYSGTDSSSPGSLSRSIQLATSTYSAFSPSGQGKIYIVDGTGPFTGFHEGMFPIDAPVQVGDIVTDVSVFYRANISNVLFNVASSNAANEARVLGVVSAILPVQTNTPGILWESVDTYTENDLGPATTMQLIPGYDLQELQATYKVVQVNAVGEGQINVCGEGGNIQAGDLIVASSTTGKGMKQSDNIVRSITVAKAREDVSFSSPTDVQMIACIYLGG